MLEFSIHVFVFRSNILATFLVDKKKVQLPKEKLIILVLIFERKLFFNEEKVILLLGYDRLWLVGFW
jgi:hypothetical protein